VSGHDGMGGMPYGEERIIVKQIFHGVA
jgi:hypothetical protein